ncbi:hypothetical protein AXX17_AT1G35430 [Arabidopsis thaliana]|uniref:Transmembrane protein n=1 Tax=Arabidopsis thaliana TaxID=3702 RepID=A0A178WAV3_ARATH|nr:hypothetical protein AXX17_AT1G35430 [Arabidopsis thaliana]
MVNHTYIFLPLMVKVFNRLIWLQTKIWLRDHEVVEFIFAFLLYFYVYLLRVF